MAKAEDGVVGMYTTYSRSIVANSYICLWPTFDQLSEKRWFMARTFVVQGGGELSLITDYPRLCVRVCMYVNSCVHGPIINAKVLWSKGDITDWLIKDPCVALRQHESIWIEQWGTYNEIFAHCVIHRSDLCITGYCKRRSNCIFIITFIRPHVERLPVTAHLTFISNFN